MVAEPQTPGPPAPLPRGAGQGRQGRQGIAAGDADPKGGAGRLGILEETPKWEMFF